MEIELIRKANDADSTFGKLFIDGKFECFTLEDEPREVKVQGKTRIPEGQYQILERKILSPLTERYRKRYGFFKWHLELQNVPGFQYIYIHVGNEHTHTDGCILVGNSVALTKGRRGYFLGNSAAAFEPLYKKIVAALERNETVIIKIK